jgi:hypothetical protein
MSTKELSAKKCVHQENMFAPRKNVCTKKKCLQQEKCLRCSGEIRQIAAEPTVGKPVALPRTAVLAA